MVWLSPVVDLLRILVWPAVVILAIVVFRVEVRSAITDLGERLESLSAGPAAARFGKKAADATAELTQAIPNPAADSATLPALRVTAAQSPVAAVEEAYDAVRDALRIRGDELDGVEYLGGSADLGVLASVLALKGKISKEVASAVGVLGNLREQALSSGGRLKDDKAAERFRDLAESILARV